MDDEWVRSLTDRARDAGIIIGLTRACGLVTAVQGWCIQNREAYEALNQVYRIIKAEEDRMCEIHDIRA